MDIRNFFGKKSSAQTGKPKPDLKTDAKLLPSPAVSSKLQSKAPSSARARAPPKKKTKVIIDDTDDSDATDWLEGESQPTRTGKSPGRNPKVVDPAVDVLPPKKIKSPLKRNVASSAAATSDSPKKKSRSTVEEGIIGVNSVDRKTRPKDSRRSRTMVSIALDDDTTEEDERPPTKTPPSNQRLKSASRSVDHVDSDEDFNDDHPDAPKENSRPKKRKAPSSTKPTTPTKKTPTKSTSKQAATGKKDQLLEPTLELASFDSLNAAPECLSGLTFVFSGILDNLGRDESVDYVKELGGRVTTAVSSKTSYLVVGDLLEDGRPFSEGSKYKKAVEIGVKVIHGEGKFYGLCKLYSDKAKGLESGESAVVATTPSSPAPAHVVVAAAPAPSINPYAKKANPYAKNNPPATQAALNPYASKNSTTSVPLMENKSAGDPNALWADKYAPTTTADILGNQDSVKKLKTWLSRWEHTFNNDKAHGKAFSSPNGPWKAALLSGPPGIGKTTTATLCAKEDNREVLEMNASDARSKKTLTIALGDVTGSQVLSFGTKRSTTSTTNATKKRCLIMDEVDGMGAGDRGGMAELIGIIKNSRVPIICICNDRQSQKIKSLLPYCLDLRYKRPVKTVIARRVMRVGEMEGMKIEQNAVEAIAESCGNDIRQVLNCLQMWSSSKAGGNSLTYRDLKERESSINKDAILRVSMFDATKQIIEGRRGLSGVDRKAAKDSLYKRSDAFFVDYSLIGINVHQNYLKVMVGGYQEAVRSKDDAKMDAFVDRMHESTLAMSDFAVGEQAVRGGDMNWSLLPFLSMMTVKTGYHAGGENGGFLGGFPEFAGWMGKNSTRGKKSRLLNELGYHMNYKVSTDKADLRLYYLPVLRARFMALLADGDKAKITEAIALMDEYGLDRNDVFENIDEFKIDSKAKGLNDIDSKQKAAFTREYNQGSHKSQALVHEQGAGKVSKASRNTASVDPASLDAVDDDKVEESDDEEEELSEEKLKELLGKKTRKSNSKSVKGKSK